MAGRLGRPAEWPHPKGEQSPDSQALESFGLIRFGLRDLDWVIGISPARYILSIPYRSV